MNHILFFFLAIFAVLFWGIRDAFRPTFSLKKDDWSCTLYHEYTTTHMVLVGKVTVPQIITHKDCIRWEHK